ncbi:MAG TPA: short-chain dehydrogenase, partial [Candidatus Competibacteraceae bacterium]|nr:short-chain dehydrogenase [Candidatus Competibacteraceae bacterium]
AALVAESGSLDALVANLAIAAPTTLTTEVTEQEWHETFGALVHPL